MTAPTAELVDQRIMEDVETTLKAISPTSVLGDFWTDVGGRVFRFDMHPMNLPQLPAIAVLYGETKEQTYDATGLVECFLGMHVFCVAPKNETWKRDIARFAADVKHALRIDVGRGNLAAQANAFDTNILDTVLSNAADGFDVAMARVDVQVHYRHLFNDPTASA